MPKKFVTIWILIAIAFCPGYASTQQNSSTPKAKDAADEARREKAYELLESLAGQLGTLQSPENRARIGSNIAWSLWTHNETRARQVFALVQQDINAGLQIPDIQEPEDVHTLMVFLRLRSDTVERIAKHDPELAYDFFKATELNPEIKLSDEARSGQKEIEAHLAKQVGANSPDLALQLGRKLLARGFSTELMSVLTRLNRKHKAQAATLFKEMVQKLADTDLATDWNGRYFAMSLARSMMPPAGDEGTFRELVGLFVKVAVANGCTRKMSDEEEDERANICRSLGPAVSMIEKVNPSRGHQLERWKVENEYSYWDSSPYSELEEIASEGTVDDVLALAAKYPMIEVDIHYRAFLKARSDGDLEKANKIATEYTGNPERQRAMLAQIKDDQVRKTITEEQLAQVQKQLQEIQGTQQRIIFLASIANQLGESDRKAALKLLKQATEITETMKPGREQMASQMALAMIYCYQKSERCFAIMETLVPKFNELVEASAKLDGYETRYLRNGEWNMTGEGPIGDLLTALAQNANYFAWCDFDRAVTLAAQFERAEIRMMAQLKLAQGILAGPPKPPPFRYSGYQH